MSFWKEDWSATKQRFLDWWRGKGFLVGSWSGTRLTTPHAVVTDPGPPASVDQQWTDLAWRVPAAHRQAAGTGYPLDTLPIADPWLGPGSMALYLGSAPGFSEETVWYEPCLDDAALDAPLKLDPDNRWWRFQLELIERMITAADGHYLVGCPDMVENWDILASLRGTTPLMMDMLDRPAWVVGKLEEVHRLWCAAYECVYALVRAQDDESMFGWFRLWAPGKVAKVQCDGAAMISPDMFRRFVVPTLAAQCDWLDYSMFHLDGSQCLCHLDALLEIRGLTAIEWTPDPKAPSGGSPHWYDLYRRILAAGKRVQVLGAHADEIEPLLDAVGADGIYFLCFFSSEAEAERYARVVARLR